MTIKDDALLRNCTSSLLCLAHAPLCGAAAAAATAATAILVAVFSASWCSRLRVSAATRSVANVMLSTISQYTMHSSMKTPGCISGGSIDRSFVVARLVRPRKRHSIMMLATVFLTLMTNMPLSHKTAQSFFIYVRCLRLLLKIQRVITCLNSCSTLS